MALFGLLGTGSASAKTSSATVNSQQVSTLVIPSHDSASSVLSNFADPTPPQEQCIEFVLGHSTPDKVWSDLLACVNGQVEVLKAWLQQACVTSNLIPDFLRPILCGG
jgi:hypothetical protein